MAGQKVILVEGRDDKFVLENICCNRGIPLPDEVIQLGGDNPLLEHIPVRLRASQEEGDVVGVVIDADTDLDARWQSIRDALIGVGYRHVPAQPDPSGTILEPPGGSVLPRVGVWIMPDNQGTGNLETFLRFLIPQPSALFDHVKASVDSIPEQRFIQNDKLKAIIHTWLAWQEEPGKPYGTAITARFLDPAVPQVDVLVSWVRRLFFQPAGIP